jgi:hypothetical protein
MISRPVVGTIPPWADAGDKTQPPDSDISIGFPHSNDKPTRQVMNWALNYTTNGVLYLVSRGLPDWAAPTNYITGDVCRSKGKFYCAKTATIGAEPSVSPTQWELLYVFASDLNTLYLTQAAGDARYLKQSDAVTTYESIASATAAHNNLQTQIDGIPAAADSKYLSITDAAATYETITAANTAHSNLQSQIDSISLSPAGGYDAGAGISISNGIISNTAPNLTPNWLGVAGSGSEIQNRPPITVASGVLQISDTTGNLLEGISPLPGVIANHVFYSSGLPLHSIVGRGGELALVGMGTFDGTNWTAQSNVSSRLAVCPANINPNGGFAFYGNAGLTVGTTFTPTVLETIAPLVSGMEHHTLYFNGNSQHDILSGSGLIIGAGQTFDGTNWTARLAAPSELVFVNGGFQFGGNTGLTVGAVFTPTIIATLSVPAAGNSQFQLAGAGTICCTGSANFAAGGHLGAGPAWIADATGFADIVPNISGAINFFANTGLTVGSTFSAALIAAVSNPSSGINQFQLKGTGVFCSPLSNNLVAGAHFIGGGWVADATGFANFAASPAGQIVFQVNTGLTAGNAFAATTIRSHYGSGAASIDVYYYNGVANSQIFTGGGLYLGGQVTWNGANWIAQAASGSALGINSPGYSSPGGFAFLTFGGSGLTVGATINPTVVATLDSAGNFSCNAALASTTGNRCRSGAGGALKGNSFNIDYTTGAQLWIDVSNLGTISVASDYRVKKNIQPLKSALAQVLQLRPVSFEYADIDGDIFRSDNVIHAGFIAHEVQALFPGAVFGKKDELTSDGRIQPQTLNWSDLMAVLTKSVQELAFRLTIIETVLTNMAPKEA